MVILQSLLILQKNTILIEKNLFHVLMTIITIQQNFWQVSHFGQEVEFLSEILGDRAKEQTPPRECGDVWKGFSEAGHSVGRQQHRQGPQQKKDQ